MAPQKNSQDFSSELFINNAHDHLFRESMQDIEIARQLAFLSLPSKVQSSIDWETLEIVKDIWIDEKLKEHCSDILYRAKILRNDQWVYLLFEHKSAPDKKIHRQLLRYIIEIWDQHEKQNGLCELWSLVLPIVICHSNRPCKFNNSITAMIAIIKGSEEVIPDFRFYMLDLWFFKPEQLEAPSAADYCEGLGKLKMLLLALKYSRHPDILKVLPQIIKISEKVYVGSDKYDYLKVVLTYLASVISRNLIDELWRIVAKEHKGGEVYMETIADAFRQEERLKREKVEREVTSLRKEIKQKDTELEQKDAVIEQKDAVIEQKDTVIEQKDTELKQKDSKFEQKEGVVHQMVHRMIKKGISLQSIEEITV